MSNTFVERKQLVCNLQRQN